MNTCCLCRKKVLKLPVKCIVILAMRSLFIMKILYIYMFLLNNVLLSCIERCGRVVSTPASYSGGPGFKSRPRDRLS
jgi:hypothetical protein